MNIGKYRDAELKKPINPFYAVLEPHLPDAGQATDLGCGTGKGASWLATHGFKVLAIDSDPEMIAVANDLYGESENIDFQLADMASIDLPPAQLVTAVFSLFFLTPTDLIQTVNRVKSSLAHGGVFGGQFLGADDDWSKTGATTHSLEELIALLSPLEIVRLDEVNRDGKTIWGEPKHWHVFHVIARKS